MVLPPVSQDTHARQLDEARAALGDAAFAAAWAEGRALSLDAAVAVALEQTAAPETQASRD
jgi:hypothetical protein